MKPRLKSTKAAPPEKGSEAPSLASSKEVFCCRVRPETAKAYRGQASIVLALPASPKPFALGDRLLLREWFAGPTGAAHLLKVTRLLEDGRAEAVRTWGWSQGKTDDDLTSLGLVAVHGEFPMMEEVSGV